MYPLIQRSQRVSFTADGTKVNILTVKVKFPLTHYTTLAVDRGVTFSCRKGNKRARRLTEKDVYLGHFSLMKQCGTIQVLVLYG